MLRSIFLLSTAVLILSSSTATASTQCDPGAVAARYPSYAGKVVKIAASPTQPPFAFVDPKNPDEMTGLEVEMIEGVMQCAGLRYELIKGAWAGLLPAVFAGSADVMIGNVNYRPDRAEKADFVLYVLAGQSVVVQKGNPRRISTQADLCGASGTATMGSSSAMQIQRLSQSCIERGKPPIAFQPAADADAAYRLVSNNRFDFAMDEAASASTRLLSEPNFELAYTATTDIKGGFVVTKGNKEMLAIVSDGMKVQEQNGTLLKLMKKYGLPPSLLVPVEARR